MPEPVINEDELIGFILRKTSFDHSLAYDEVRSVLDAEMDFLKRKGLVEESDATKR